MTSNLYNLDVPDEMAELALKDASTEEILSATHRIWHDAIIGEKIVMKTEQIYREALRIIAPFRRRFSGDMKIEPSMFERNASLHNSAGIYMSALLNVTGIEKMVVDGKIEIIDEVGYRICRGKRIEVAEGSTVYNLASFAEGGTVINRGKTEFLGYRANSGNFINNGEVKYLGEEAKSGNFINRGKIERIGNDAKGGNFLSGQCIDYEKFPTGGINFLGQKTVSAGRFFDFEGFFMLRCARNILDDRKWLSKDTVKKDKVLAVLMEELCLASNNDNFQKIEELADKIDEHVHKNYTRHMA